ncbi:hypothetical protein H2136_20860 [Aeromonas hydrophila]|uniref:Uncharacterized protein n=1 Tax=Aeromonas hydrophila TaxID=644 RepID=A0A926IYH2_AERHY|nr:hypothetical protein [Aeromonas hydrophila]
MSASASMVAMEVTEQFKRWYPTAINVTEAEKGSRGLDWRRSRFCRCGRQLNRVLCRHHRGSSGGLYDPTDR